MKIVFESNHNILEFERIAETIYVVMKYKDADSEVEVQVELDPAELKTAVEALMPKEEKQC